MSSDVKNQLVKKRVSAEIEILALRSRLGPAQIAADGRCKAYREAIAMLGDNPENAHLRKKLEDKIKKERQVPDELAAQLAEAEAMVEGYRDAIKMMEKDSEDASAPELRAGSELYRIREAIRVMGQPLTLTQMLETLGEQDNPAKRNSVRGSVGRYARDGKIFVQTRPNTFGLLELNHKPESSVETVEVE